MKEVYKQITNASRRGHGFIKNIHSGTQYEHRTGGYVGYEGEVTIYSEPNIATFSFRYHGKDYYMCVSNLEQPYTDAGLIRIAGRVYREVINGKFKP